MTGEPAFYGRLNDRRALEVSSVLSAAYYRAGNLAVMQMWPVAMSLLAFLTLALTGNGMRAADIFSALALFYMLRMPLLMLPLTIADVTNAHIAIIRITK